jgi:IstB-like ATP binding protein
LKVLEERARAAVRRSAIFPLTTMETYDFDSPKSIERDLVAKAATLAFVEDKANVVLLGPSALTSPRGSLTRHRAPLPRAHALAPCATETPRFPALASR